jgi:CO/xanthine dehydrogenase Mo-binding subunit
MATTYTVIGQPLRRAEGADKVTGRQQYTADVLLPGTLWGKALRSTVPHARIVRIDTAAARALPGVHAVLTAADLPDRLIGRRMYDITMLARGRVRYVGEKVAVVAADDPDIAEEALALIDVGYEELPAVYDPFAAMEPDAPLLHPDFATYRNHAPEAEAFHNVQSYATWGQGDLDRGFAEADLVFEDEFTLAMQHQGHIEPHGCLIAIDDGQVRIWHTGKQPFQTRDWLAEAVGLPQERITVYPATIGGDFGGKGFLTDEPVAYYLARATGRPIKMLMSYAEELTAGVPRHGAVIKMKSGVMRDGRLVARHVRLCFNGGAFGGYKPNLNLGGARYACGSYRIPNARVESWCVYTNQIPCGHMRSPGEAQAVFAVESHTDMLARRLGMDPVAFRLRNVVELGDVTAIGEHWSDPRAGEVVERAAAELGWGAPRSAPNVGRGISTCNHDIGQGKAGSIVAVDASGAVTVITGVPDVGTGAHTMLRQVVAEELSIAPDDVTVQIGDTDTALWDSGSGGQRVTNVHGNATLGAARKLRDTLCELAPDLMRWPASAVRLERGEFMADGEGRSVAFRELASRAARTNGGRVAAQETLALSYESTERTYTAQAVEVAVDPETGQVTIQRLVSVQDCGRVLNLILAEGQVQGGTITALGYAMMEELPIEDGRVTTAHLGEYKLPSMQDIPEMQSVFVEGRSGPCPFESKAVGEAAISPLSAAVANAIEDAVGVRVTSLPLTAEKVHRLLREQRPPAPPA